VKARALSPALGALALGSCVLPALEVDENAPEPGEAGSTATGGASGAGKGGASGKGGTSGKGGGGGSGAGAGGASAAGGTGGSAMAGTSGPSSGAGGSVGGSGGASGTGGSVAGSGGAAGGAAGAGGNAGAGGTPVTCDGGFTACGDTCRDLSADRENCGDCGMKCAGVLGCFDGECGCDPDAADVTLCPDKCSVLSSDPENCGDCGIKCEVGEICEMGTCVSECTPAVAGPPMVEAIDDLEDGNLTLGDYNAAAIQRGYWWFAHDETPGGAFSPDPFLASSPGRDSAYAVAVSGAGYTDWGSQVGFSLHSPSSISCPIDGSDFRGISFAYRGASSFSLRVSTVDSMPRPSGTCPLGAPYCYNTYRAEVPASTEWAVVEVLWDAFELHPGSPPFDPTQLVTVTFDFLGDRAFDLAIDDVQFVY
jgi:hypothetical protein